MSSSFEQERSLKAERIVIKIGTSSVTNQHGVCRSKLEKIVDELSFLQNQGKDVVLVSSGAIAAGKRTVNDDLSAKQAASTIGQTHWWAF